MNIKTHNTRPQIAQVSVRRRSVEDSIVYYSIPPGSLTSITVDKILSIPRVDVSMVYWNKKREREREKGEHEHESKDKVTRGREEKKTVNYNLVEVYVMCINVEEEITYLVFLSPNQREHFSQIPYSQTLHHLNSLQL